MQNGNYYIETERAFFIVAAAEASQTLIEVSPATTTEIWWNRRRMREPSGGRREQADRIGGFSQLRLPDRDRYHVVLIFIDLFDYRLSGADGNFMFARTPAKNYSNESSYFYICDGFIRYLTM